ncbi:hypothetical protein JB92DRAFT_101505 [Gautieria morchelliformis]|nr:hypothetical protein JB92DRAFT_101505 [Gautieria morchelliformis]
MRHTLRPLPPSSSTSEPRFHTTACDKSSKSTSTLDRLETICAVLAHLDKVASKTQVPGFGLAVTTARSIVDTLRDAKIAGYRRMTTGDMKANVDKFFSDLDEINKYLTQIKNRGRFEAVFYAFTGQERFSPSRRAFRTNRYI